MSGQNTSLLPPPPPPTLLGHGQRSGSAQQSPTPAPPISVSKTHVQVWPPLSPA
ncbi:hypothetical protein HK100_008693 [Physocladia obscura]|uniref:Uncharacterized protein n=1 Tax=Physocladia obscura TaxID=109957 RepID=A0AAD5SQD8_9FUNG|nr:hypothetical protein HK100_008693 [Physocladia obscura]